MALQPARFDVAISGASYAGMALACALADALGDDLRIALIDRTAPPASSSSGGHTNGPTDARAFALSAASRHLLQAIGVWDKIAHAAQPVTTIELTNSPLAAGIRPVLLRYDNVTGAGEAATHIVPAHLLGDVLRARVSAHRSVEMLAPATATGFTASDTSARVQLADGREITAALVIAADGRKSILREAAGIKLIGWDYAQTGIVTTVQHAHPHDGRAVQHFLPGGPFAILPLTGNRACITWSEEAQEAARILALDDTGFLREVEKRFGGRLGAITLEGPRQSWPLSMHLARNYVAARFALIGDAAHGVHPIAGQGLNLGLRDVAALTEAVADNMRLGFDAGDAQALRRYERWRRFDSAVSTATFDSINRLFSSDATLLRSAREFGLGIVDRVPALKRFFVEEAAGLTGDVPKLLKGERI